MKHKHHVIPRHMGGSDDPSNLIELSVEEHAEAHKKLFEQYGNQFDYIAWQSLSGLITKEEARRLAISASLTGRKQSAEQIEKRVKARLKTRPHSTLGQKNKPASEERKRKISEANKGKPSPFKNKERHTNITKQLMSESAKNRKLYKCPKCNCEMQKANLVRYHGLDGEKCKSSTTFEGSLS